MDSNTIIGLMGPTASGKTKFAVSLADKFNAEIISMDSRQVYKGLTIGTGKDLQEYTINGRTIPYHLIDIVDVNTPYHIHQFKLDFEEVYQTITKNNNSVIACGGTGLYFDVLLNNREFTGVPVNEELRLTLNNYSHAELIEIIKIENKASIKFDDSTKKRSIRAVEIIRYLKSNTLPLNVSSNYNWKLYAIFLPANIRNARIDSRLTSRIEEGLFEEVETLLNKGISADRLIYFGLEYKFITQYILGELTKEECVEKLKIAIHQFAKRQMTFFRKIEKDGHRIEWLDGTKELSITINN